MKRWKRSMMLALAPPGLGAVLLFVAVLISEMAVGRWRMEWAFIGSLFSYLGIYLFFAYLIAGAPSLLYAAVMEWRFARGLNPRSWRAVWLSTGLGGAAGLGMIGAMLAISRPTTGFTEWWIFGIFAGLGVVVGFVVGACVRGMGRALAR